MLPSSFPFPVSSPKVEGILQVSKWLKVQVLLDGDEMKGLLEALRPVHFVVVSEPVAAAEAVISSEQFAEKYREYADLLKGGKVPQTETLRRYFSSAMSKTLDPFYAMPAGEKFLMKPLRPVVQLQAHHFFYSTLDGKFHPMVLSPESISWGLQFSYPQLYQDPRTRQVVKVTDAPEFPNTALFSKLQKWIRSETLPTPFLVAGVRINPPIRIGKKSLAWIKSHPQLKQKGIQIYSMANL